ICFFFFSSRRRHTRSKRDWSSDVCSSDLTRTRWPSATPTGMRTFTSRVRVSAPPPPQVGQGLSTTQPLPPQRGQIWENEKGPWRSEERRVGKECRARWSAEGEKERGECRR